MASRAKKPKRESPLNPREKAPRTGDGRAWVAVVRDLAGLTQQAMADKAGVARNKVGTWGTKTDPSFAQAQKVRAAFYAEASEADALCGVRPPEYGGASTPPGIQMRAKVLALVGIAEQLTDHELEAVLEAASHIRRVSRPQTGIANPS